MKSAQCLLKFLKGANIRMSRQSKGYCLQSCRYGPFIRCQHYVKWLTDSTTRTQCYLRGHRFKAIDKEEQKND